jgi:hypothetical protein
MAARTPAFRRYRRRSIISAAAYVASVGVGTVLIPDNSPPSAGPVALAVLAGAAVVFGIWALARYLGEIEDEYLRMLQIRGILVATGVTLALTNVWGLVELFTTAPRVPIFFVYPLWCAGLLVGAWSNKRFVGDTGEAC